ncbi:hypothetical protein [Pseudokineococcus sp. 1T1Z-3]|uniref:hypothetical protein n=1 Tax=Pseudokineococcus sp. 1T1Z-3 TaxID=3132745 RepID=UPI00309CAF34
MSARTTGWSATAPGTLRGAAAGAALVLLVVTLPLLLDPAGRTAAPFSVLFAVPGALLGGVCGQVAGRLLDARRPWWQAALASSVLGLLLLLGVLLVLGALDPSRLLLAVGTIGWALGVGVVLLATWQSWSLARRRSRLAVG